MTGNHGQRLGLANLAAEFQAVFAGDHDVEQKERGPLAFGFGEDGVSGGIEFHGEAGALQMMAHQPGNVRIVFDYGDLRFHGRYCSCINWRDLAWRS